MTDLGSVEPSDRRLPFAAQVSCCRDAYGHLQSLAMRPRSEGNAAAIDHAVASIRQILEVLQASPDPIIPADVVQLSRRLFTTRSRMRPEMAARTLLSTFEWALRALPDPNEGLPLSFAPVGDRAPPISEAVVQVGPTIGVGDELLIARALSERVAELGGIPLRVSSSRPDLWQCLAVAPDVLGPPPFGAVRHIEHLNQERARTSASLFVDFLRSDPCVGLPAAECAISARWFMGTAEADYVCRALGQQGRLEPPRGLPKSRWLESRWFAGHLLPGARRSPGSTLWANVVQRRAATDPFRIVLQTLTTKPQLLYPASFYASILADLRRQLDVPVRVDIVPCPRSGVHPLVDAVTRAVRRAIGEENVRTHSAMSLTAVAELVHQADVVFGPDTFSSHLAALLGVPQVSFLLPQHVPWLTLGAAAFAVPARPLAEGMEGLAAHWLRVVALVSANSDPNLAQVASEWRSLLRRVDAGITAFLRSDDPAFANGLTPEIQRVNAIYKEHRASVLGDLGLEVGQASLQLAAFEPAFYVDARDRALSIARWYHAMGISELSSIFAALPVAASTPYSGSRPSHDDAR